jgi:LmbE family N-acetylglucosaminyl deacetylase
MKKIKKITLGLGTLLTVSIALLTVHLYQLAESDIYPEDDFLQNEPNKHALIIVAHDDDAVSMAGIISRLCKNGWNVQQMCYYQGWEGNDSVRKINLREVARIQGIRGVEFKDFVLRKQEHLVDDPWRAIPYNDFDSIYHVAAVRQDISSYIERNQPSIIFSLDDSIGGYGHPEHILVSRLVRAYCMEHAGDSAFSVKRIYQAVFDPRMNRKILKDLDAYKAAKEVYGFEDTPRPSVQITITGEAEQKKAAMIAYRTEQRTLTKIWPYYAYVPALLYFRIFDREFYRVFERTNAFRSELH